ncbi:MAG: hypothetical protein F6J86_16890 [Symploca sp. SIO1B1]|nr:hypothetical protein [Symploca sp. SIO1A3]NER95489.1 hypothetical protein [Symploca sp. SIO1B1]
MTHTPVKLTFEQYLEYDDDPDISIRGLVVRLEPPKYLEIKAAQRLQDFYTTEVLACSRI